MLKILSLEKCWRRCIVQCPDPGQEKPAFISRTVARQIALIAKEGIQDAEKKVLLALDKVIYSLQGLGQETQIGLWACLWSLILLYRDIIDDYQGWAESPHKEHSSKCAAICV